VSVHGEARRGRVRSRQGQAHMKQLRPQSSLLALMVFSRKEETSARTSAVKGFPGMPPSASASASLPSGSKATSTREHAGRIRSQVESRRGPLVCVFFFFPWLVYAYLEVKEVAARQ